MEQNRYSRQLIVLRAVIGGYSGHARLIQSGGETEMELRVQTPSGSAQLWAALVEKSEEGYQSCPLGQLAVDDRGQATGTFPLTGTSVAPEILAIVQQDDAGCKLAMSGFLNGPRSVNWADVRAAACDAVTENACTAATPATSRLPDPAEETDSSGSESSEQTFATAAEAAGISPEAIWPEEIAALQEAFETQAAVPTFVGTRYTFVLIPAATDQPEYLAGVWCVHGDPARAAYAVPADDPNVQPPELEGFQWRSCAEGGGYWVAYVDATTGEPVQNDY